MGQPVQRYHAEAGVTVNDADSLPLPLIGLVPTDDEIRMLAADRVDIAQGIRLSFLENRRERTLSRNCSSRGSFRKVVPKTLVRLPTRTLSSPRKVSRNGTCLTQGGAR